MGGSTVNENTLLRSPLVGVLSCSDHGRAAKRLTLTHIFLATHRRERQLARVVHVAVVFSVHCDVRRSGDVHPHRRLPEGGTLCALLKYKFDYFVSLWLTILRLFFEIRQVTVTFWRENPRNRYFFGTNKKKFI